MSFSSVTHAVHADIRQRVRQQMMGWPVDLRRFLAGAFAGGLLWQLAPCGASCQCLISIVSWRAQQSALSCSSCAHQQQSQTALGNAGAISKTATAPIESVRMQIMTGNKVGRHATSCILCVNKWGRPSHGAACRRACGGLWRKHGRAAASSPSSAAMKQVRLI